MQRNFEQVEFTVQNQLQVVEVFDCLQPHAWNEVFVFLLELVPYGLACGRMERHVHQIVKSSMISVNSPEPRAEGKIFPI